MVRIFLLLIISTILVTSCDSSNGSDQLEPDQIEIRNDQIANITENDTETYDSEEVEEVIEITDPNEVPSFKDPVDAAKYEGLILSDSGVYVYQDPDSNSTRLGMLGFGEHVFTIVEINEWAYIAANDVQGWILSSDVKEIPYDSSKKIEVTNPNDILTLVNKTYRLPRDYAPNDLMIPNIAFPFDGTDDRKRMREEAALKLEELFLAATNDGVELFGISGYRSFATQSQIFPSNVKRNSFEWANQFSAFPGESEHQTGLAMDVSSKSAHLALTEEFGDTKEGIWVKENAHRFGYIIRYPKGKESITGYTYEPWHLRYVGVEAAKEIFASNITLEEYLGKH